jgi:uroporphyrinogen-III synthase
LGTSDRQGRIDEERLPPNGLEGLVVGIPAARKATETAALVQRWGGTPLIGPAVEEIPVGDDEALRAGTEAVAAEGPAWSVHLTGVGTKRWLDQAEAWGLLPGLLDRLRSAGVVARGRKTVRALGDRGLEPAFAAETTAEIAEWLGPRVQHGEAVALQRHGEPSPALASALAAAGARLTEIVTYRWAIPEDRGPAERLVRSLAAGEVHALLITSVPQSRHLFVLARDLGLEDQLRDALTTRVFVAAVGTVAAGGLRTEGVDPDLVASPARLGVLVRSLVAARDQVRAKSSSA